MRTTKLRGKRNELTVIVALCVAAIEFGMLTFAAPAGSAARTYFVDMHNSACSDLGPGTESTPYCTVIKGAAVVDDGEIVLVRSGVYLGEVKIGRSGSPGAPVTLKAAPGAHVVITGGDRGFYVPARHDVVISGFTVTDTANHAIYVSGSKAVTIENNDVSYAGDPISGLTARGIYVSDTTDSLVRRNVVHHNSDSGIYLVGTTTNVTVGYNETYANARGYTRAAVGIDLRAAGNIVVGNVSHDNEDSGIQVYTGSGTRANNNLVINNVCYRNDDHGIDVLRSTGQRIVGNTIYRNSTAGINLEGTTESPSSGTLANNISVDNGVGSTRTRGNIRVDSSAVPGTTMNTDMVFLTSPGTMVQWGTGFYSSLASFRAATGQESNGIEADPRWEAPAAADFHLQPGSPAIDSADSGASGQSGQDAEEKPRFDDPATPNSGAGSRSYDDRGALEYQGPGSPPVAADDAATTDEDTTVLVDVLSNDSDPDGNTLTVSSVTNPPHGTTSIALDGRVVYEPDPGYAGSDSFSYSISDGRLGSDTAGASITVRPVEDPPVARDDFARSDTNATTVIDVLANDTDEDGDELTISEFTTPVHGVVAETSAGISYRPELDYGGPDAFTYTVTDGHGNFDTADVSVSVNSPPHAVDDEAVVDEDVSIEIDVLANDTDVDEHALTVQSATTPSHGSAAVGATGRITYVPDGNYAGPDSFAYTVTDSQGASDVGIVTISVRPVPDPPDARDDSVTTSVDSGVPILVLDNDVEYDGETLSVVAVTQPPNGSVAVDEDDVVHYTPPEGFSGTDTFTYTASDGTDVDTASVAVAVNDVPEVFFSLTPEHGAAPLLVTVDASASFDSDDFPIDSYTFDFGDGTIVGPQTAAIATHTYAESGGYTITVTATDEAGASAAESSSISVGPRNLIGNPGVEAGKQGWAPLGTGVTIERVTGGHSGDWALAVTNGGTATTSCAVNDSPNWITTSAAGTYATSVWVRADAGGHVLKMRLREYQGNTTVGSIVANLALTTEWQQLSLAYAAAAPGQSTLDLNAYVTQAPPGVCFYADDFKMTLIDTRNPGSPPIAADDFVDALEDSSAVVDVLANDLDPDGDILEVTAVTDPLHGAASIGSNGNITYRPDAGYNGLDSMTYTISDGRLGTDVGTIAVTVDPVEDAPVAVDDRATTASDTAIFVDVLVNDRDEDGDSLSVTSVGDAEHGSATQEGHGIRYTPATGSAGEDSFTYTVGDGNGNTDTGRVTVSVTRHPVTIDDVLSVDEDSTAAVDVLANDSDPDGDALDVIGASGAAHGSVEVNADNTVSYTPDANYNGPDSFDYTVFDDHGGTASASVAVTINSVEDAPEPADDAAITGIGVESSIDVLANDLDADGDDLSVARTSTPAHGIVSVDAQGVVAYSPEPGFSGTDSFTYDAHDGTSAASATVTVVVDDAPAPNLVVTPSEGAAPLAVVADAAGSTDGDGFPIATYGFSFGDGTVVGPQAGSSASHTYTAHGDYTVRVTVTDAAGLFSTATSVVSVGPPNLVGNPGFETDLTGWAAAGTGTTLTRITGGRTGDWALHVANSGTGSTSCTLNDSPNWIRTTGTGTYTTSFWAKAPTPGGTLKFRLREYQGSTLVGFGQTEVVLTSEWQKLSFTYSPVASGLSNLDLNAWVPSAPTGTCFVADDFVIKLM